RAGNILQRLHRLGISITGADDLAVRASRSGSRNVNVWPNSHRPRVANDRLPWRATRNIHALHRFHFSSAERNAYCTTVSIPSGHGLILRQPTVFSAPAYTYARSKKLAAIVLLCQSHVCVKPRVHSRVSK